MNPRNLNLIGYLVGFTIIESDFDNASRSDYSKPSREWAKTLRLKSSAQQKRDRKNQKRLASRNGAK